MKSKLKKVIIDGDVYWEDIKNNCFINIHDNVKIPFSIVSSG